jgi:uncharacterized protein (TIGR00297 family)
MDIIAVSASVLLAALVAFITIKKKAFTVPAALSACVMLIVAAGCSGWSGIVIVLAAYFTIFAVDMVVGDRSEKVTGSVNQRTGARGIVQVIANALAATIAAVMSAILKKPELMMVYAAALTECLADSLASDVGVLSKKDPVDICRMKRIKRGLSGGVSLLGTLSALAGCVWMFLISLIFFGLSVKLAVAVILIPMIGIAIDSVLGSLVQAKYECTVCGKSTEKTVHCGQKTNHVGGLKLINNDAVNIISNFLTAILAAVYVLLF